MGDLFHEDVQAAWIIRVFEVMVQRPDHTFMILTKRPERMKKLVEGCIENAMGEPVDALKNVYLGVTAENQEMADQRIPILLQTPAAKRFVSVEPCLGPVNLTRGPRNDLGIFGNMLAYPPMSGPSRSFGSRLDWVICGGESGPSARFMHPHWVENLRDQCTEAGVPFFFKGWGTKMMKKSDPGYMKIDGREWKEFPLGPTLVQGTEIPNENK
jgi:protein gp37